MSALLHAVGVRRGRGVAPGIGAAGAVSGVVGRAGRVLRRRGARPGVMRHRRRRGISGAELRGFKKVARLLADFGMRPRGLAHPMHRRVSRFSRRRRGDIGD